MYFSPYIASLRAIAVLFCFVALFFSCEEGAKLSADKKIDQLVLTVGGADMPVTFGADYNAALTVPFGTDLTAITIKTLLVSAKATSSVAQGDVLTITNGSAMLTVTAEDGSKQVYTIKVMIAPAPPRTGAGLTALTATIAGQTYSSTGDNPLVAIRDNTISITLPLLFGSTLPTDLSLSLTVLTLSEGASSTPAQGATLDLSTEGMGMISVQAEDPNVTVSYTVSLTTEQPVLMTYTGTDTLGIAVRDVVTETGRSVSFSAMDTVIRVSGLADASFDWALGTLQGTKTATAGAFILTQSDLAMFPATADATYAFTVSANGQTSEGKTLFYYPGQLRTWRDLQGVRVDLKGTYRMMRDIAFPDEDGDGVSEYNFESLGRDTDVNAIDFQGDAFSGTFDGAGHEIRNLYIDRSTESFVGLFGQLSGTVRNVGLVGGAVTGNTIVGALVGVNLGTLQDAYATGAVTGSRSAVGGLVGGNVSTIIGVYATGAVTSDGDTVGGLVGGNEGTIEDAYATGVVTGDDTVGGLVGGNEGTIEDAYATGVVTGDDTVGGLVGGNDGTIEGTYATGAVMGIDNVGGLLGSNEGTLQGTYATGTVMGAGDVGGLVGGNEGTIEGTYATGAVTGERRVGGLVGDNTSGSVAGSYARGNVVRAAGSTATTFGRLVGSNSGMNVTATGYHSSQTGESQLLSAVTDGNPTPLTGAKGVDGTARTSASVQADFTGFEFGEEIGKWIYTAGRWPALYLGDLQSAADQPTQ